MALSAGNYYVPKNLDDNRAYRRRLNDACLESQSARDQVKRLCTDDVLFYVNSFAWTFRPKAKGDEATVVPFVTWSGQDQIFQSLVSHIDRQVPLVAEKSRDAGWSWACIYTADWLWRFHSHKTTGLSSRVADLVDSKSPDSLFWKLRFVQKWLPRWLWPEGWTKRIHDTEMHYENPETGSIVTGHPTTKDIGVAGRCTWFVFDEFSRVPNAKSVLDNTKDTSDCRVFVSTHTAPGTQFHQLCTNGVTDKIVTHWSEHPGKSKGLYRYHPEKQQPHDIEILDKSYTFDPDYPFVRDGTPSGGPWPCVRSPWYDQECKERSRTDTRTNLDVDVAGSTSQFFNATLIRRLVLDHGRDPDWIGDVMLKDEGAELVTLETGPLRLWIERNMRGQFRRSRYVIGIDIAAGTGATPSCLTVFDAVRRVKVAEYTNAFIEPTPFAAVAAGIGRMFTDPSGWPAKVAWDAGGSVGKKFGERFMGSGYPNVYYHKGPMGYAGIEAETDKPGWYGTNNEIKATMLMDYATALEKRSYLNPSKAALEELLQFRWVEGRVEHATEKNAVDDSAARENHADHGIADGLSWMLVEDKTVRDDQQPEPDQDPPPGSWEWRRRLGEDADRDLENDGWQDS